MTKTADDARPGTAGKRRARPNPRRRPQSRNPSAPMQQPESADDPPGAPPAGEGSGEVSRPARTTRREESGPSKPARGSGAASGAASGARPAAEESSGAGKGPGEGSPPASARSGAAEVSRPARTTRRKEPGPSKPSPAGKADPPPTAPDDGGRLRRAWRALRPVRRGMREGSGPPLAARLHHALTRAVHHLDARRLPLRRITPPRWWPTALCVLAGLLTGLVYGLLRPPQYTATSYVAVVPGEKGDPMTALGFAQAYGRIATDSAVLVRAQRESGVPVATLKSSVEAVTSPDAPLIEITGHAPRAGEAADVANAVARSLTEVADDSAKATGVELAAFSQARAPREPSTPSAVLTTAVGGSAGVLVGALVLLVRPRREERLARSAVPAPAGEQPANREPQQRETAPEKEAMR